MKRFLRYLLLVFSVLILAIWSWSFSHTSEIQWSKKSDTWAIGVNWGLIHFRHQSDSKYNSAGFFWSSDRNRVYTDYINRLGLRFPFTLHSIRAVPSGDELLQ